MAARRRPRDEGQLEFDLWGIPEKDADELIHPVGVLQHLPAVLGNAVTVEDVLSRDLPHGDDRCGHVQLVSVMLKEKSPVALFL